MCGDADKMHSVIVSTTRSQRRPVLSWTCKPNERIHAQLQHIGRSSRWMVCVANTLPGQGLLSGQEGFRRYVAVSLVVHLQRIVTIR